MFVSLVSVLHVLNAAQVTAVVTKSDDRGIGKVSVF